jgi:hypothetical protein
VQDPEDDSTQDDCPIVVASEQTTTQPAQVSECAALVTPGPEWALGDVHVSAIEQRPTEPDDFFHSDVEELRPSNCNRHGIHIDPDRG